MFQVNKNSEPATRANIKVIGVGGGGGNAVERMISAGITGVEFIAANTDAQALNKVRATKKIKLGEELTHSLGAGADPNVGREAAEQSEEDIKEVIRGADMLFVTCGLGGGTGTGAAPVIAKIAKEEFGILTVAVVTLPFAFERETRMKIAMEGLAQLRKVVDSIIVVPNEKLIAMATANKDDDISAREAFRIADDVLRQGVQGISDLINYPAEINPDFADVKKVMMNQGLAHFGVGTSTSTEKRRRVEEATKAAINNPMLDSSINGAKNFLINVTGPNDLGINEINIAANMITEKSGANPLVIVGMAFRPTREDEDPTVSVTVIATGMDEEGGHRTETTPDSERYTAHDTRKSAAPEDETSSAEAPKSTARSEKRTSERERPKHDSDELSIPFFLRNNGKKQ